MATNTFGLPGRPMPQWDYHRSHMPGFASRFFGGKHKLTGTVKNASNVAQRRELRLYPMDGQPLMAIEYSDPATGQFTFDYVNVRLNTRYIITVHDPAEVNPAEIYEGLVPVPM